VKTPPSSNICIVLRVSGLAWGPSLAKHASGLVPDRTWRKGQSKNNGSIRREPAFNLFVADARSKRSAIRKASQFMSDNSLFFKAIAERKANAVFDFGVMAGSDEAFAPTITFPVAFLKKCVLLSIEIEVSSYPCGKA
jgi:hypothetical protein